jgi:gamma-glutamyltranspeptidase
VGELAPLSIALQLPTRFHPTGRPRRCELSSSASQGYVLSSTVQPYFACIISEGDTQVQADVQLLRNVTEFGMNPQAAAEAACFSSSSFPGCFDPHPSATGQLNLEPGIPTQVRKALAHKGHRVNPAPNAG